MVHQPRVACGRHTCSPFSLLWLVLLFTIFYIGGCRIGARLFYALRRSGSVAQGLFHWGLRAALACRCRGFGGALLGFCIPLAAAMATGGTGLGGGDIKFCGILGLIYGPSGDGSGFLCGRSLCHADGPSVPKALPAPPAHRHPVLTFSCLRLLDCNAG